MGLKLDFLGLSRSRFGAEFPLKWEIQVFSTSLLQKIKDFAGIFLPFGLKPEFLRGFTQNLELSSLKNVEFGVFSFFLLAKNTNLKDLGLFEDQLLPFLCISGLFLSISGPFLPHLGHFVQFWGNLMLFQDISVPLWGRIYPFWGLFLPFLSSLGPFKSILGPFRPFSGASVPFSGLFSAVFSSFAAL